MKKVILFALLFLPQFLIAQHVVILSVMQSPEFGFSISKQDTTILKGTSIILGTDLAVFGGSGEYSYHWSPAADLSDSTTLNPIASPTDTTIYLLTVTDKFGCSFSVNYTVNTRGPFVGIHMPTSRPEIEAVLFPNPNTGNFKVRLTGIPTKNIALSIFDNIGNLVKKQIVQDFTGDQTETFQVNLTSGVYTLFINTEKETVSRQFIIR